MLSDELEMITNKVVRGNETALAIELFKDTKDLKDVLRYLNFCTDAELKEKLRGYCADGLHTTRTAEVCNSSEESDSRLSIEEWATEFGVSMSL